MAFGMELGWRPVPPAGSGTVEQAETADLVARMAVPPSSTRRAQIDALIAGLKADGAWDKLDWLCLMAAHDAQAARLNWRSAAKSLAAVNSPFFTIDRGYAGDGASAYLTLGEWLIAPGNQFARNNASMGLWCNAQGAETGFGYQLGDNGGNTAQSYIQILAADATASDIYRINTTESVTMSAGTVRTGHRSFTRSGASTSRAYRNGVLVAEGASASTASVPGASTTLLRRVGNYGRDRLAAFYAGAALADAEMAALHGRLATYLTALGAQ